jgi:hypothetical protein
MSDDFLNRNSLYYSDTMDLTSSIQAYFSGKSEPNKMVEQKFCWNSRFDCLLIHNIYRPVINGIITIKHIQSYAEEFTYIIISRKDNRRSGMRLWVRGCDDNGWSANFVETEQIIVHNSKSGTDLLSYLQIRGSIPIKWTQMPDLTLNPIIFPHPIESENLNVFEKHANELVKSYKQVVLINLVGKERKQGKLGECFNNTVNNYKNMFDSIKVDYVWFDFNAECKHMNYENISKLFNEPVISALNEDNYTHIIVSSNFTFNNFTHSDFEVVKTQQGVFRTNCIDTLDRTNIVQSIFARIALHNKLSKLNMSNNTITQPLKCLEMEDHFRTMWGDVGDALSKCYSGTGALRADFTRTGKRTFKGLLQDCINIFMRYYLNNFRDGYNQDCHDYFLGTLNPKKRDLKIHSTKAVHFIILLIFLLSMLIWRLILPSNMNFKYIVLWFLLIVPIFYLFTKVILGASKSILLNKPTSNSISV